MHKINGQVKMDLPAEVADGIYANLVLISHSDSEFVFDFARMVPGKPTAKVHSRIIMNPKNAKLLMKLLKDNIKNYENRFGTINVEGYTIMHGEREEDEEIN